MADLWPWSPPGRPLGLTLGTAGLLCGVCLSPFITRGPALGLPSVSSKSAQLRARLWPEAFNALSGTGHRCQHPKAEGQPESHSPALGGQGSCADGDDDPSPGQQGVEFRRRPREWGPMSCGWASPNSRLPGPAESRASQGRRALRLGTGWEGGGTVPSTSLFSSTHPLAPLPRPPRKGASAHPTPSPRRQLRNSGPEASASAPGPPDLLGSP